MVPTKKPRKRRQGVSTGLPTTATHRNHVWTWDFVHDVTIRGGKLRMLTVLNEFTRECRCIHVDRKINAGKVRQVMARLIDEHGAPEHIRSDNGSEFIEYHLREWLATEGIKTLYIDPGRPWSRTCGSYIESFHARFREECLNREQLWTLTTGGIATLAGVFPAFAWKLLGFVGLYGTILAPIGAIIFFDWYSHRKGDPERLHNTKPASSFRMPVLISWVIPVAAALYFIQVKGISAWYFPLPCWVACGLLYLALTRKSILNA